ncbi:MAG: enoyl-CoA hydratase/isomerase family protein [Saprospiraceae bacterium]|nr:enoyl-CoA hydratase/isomerase family protein [Saprospiraceae bacterium]
MNFKEIEFSVQDEIAVIKFNRPEVMNCVGPTTHKELLVAWEEFKTNDKLKVAVITGAGDRAFCSGGDLKSARQGGLIDLTEEEKDLHRAGKVPGILGPSRWTDIYKPIIAAVNGVAYAGGLEWACFADMRIAEEHASFGVTCRRWNIGLADGGTQRLPRIVGMGRAMELILTGKVINAEEAYRIGLANEVVPKGQSLARAIELATFLCTLPQPAMRTDKEAAVRGFGESLDEGLRIEAELFLDSIYEPETLAGLKQFNQRLHPDRRYDSATKTPGIVRQEGE